MTKIQNDKVIYVTQPSLPELGEFVESLKQIWESKILTNNGPFHEEFEKQLAQYLGVKYVSVFSNGTLALMTALQCLGIKGEVITTPYTFVATANSLFWNGITPVFCDVDPVFGNMDADKIEALITKDTAAIMPVHVYGNPCEVEKIEALARKYKLKVIYDAAHAFGVTKKQNSILNFGDLSILSFHATKTFNTIEGGAIVSHDIETKTRIDNLKNFGITDEITVVEPGINAKMNEVQCAFGLLQLKEIKENIFKRKKVTEFYRNKLGNIKGLRILEDMKDVEHNYSYFPIFVSEEFSITRDVLYELLKQNNIYARRYFYPLVSSFSPYNELPSSDLKNVSAAAKISNQVLCLPIYSNLEEKDLQRIVSLIINNN